ncbi:MAG: PKD domain-containing protein, partial [Bacteroidia bacterium]|nr:PKD domain-containing protein [Bacteroidia bacterium]
FGDGTFGQGFSVQHSYTAYGNYKVKATASKAGLSSTYIRDLPVTFHRRAVIKQLEIVQVPTFRPGGLDWDPGNLPDLSFKITFPGDTVYQSNTVLNNAESGLFNIVPAKGTFSFDQDIRFDIYDIDTGNVPDRENMGILKFRFCNVLPLSSTYTDSVQLNSGALRIKLKFEFQL